MIVTCYMTMSVDGFIASMNDETPWSDDAWQAYADFVKSRGNLIIGRRTYELTEAAGEFSMIGNPFTIVLSEKRETPPNSKILFVKTPEEALAMMRGQGFTDVILGGGGMTNGSFLRAGLIDELVLDIESHVLNSGKRLFGSDPAACVLRLMGTEKIGTSLVRLRYKVQR